MSTGDELDRLTSAYREGRLTQDEYALLVSRLGTPTADAATARAATRTSIDDDSRPTNASAPTAPKKPVWKRTWVVVSAVVIALFALGEFVVAPGLGRRNDDPRSASRRQRTNNDDLTFTTVPLPTLSQQEATVQVRTRAGLQQDDYNDPGMIKLFEFICQSLERKPRREGMYLADVVTATQIALSADGAPSAVSKDEFALELVRGAVQSSCPVWLPALQGYIAVR